MKTIIENIPAKLLRAAMPFAAGNSDIRFYLHGIHLNSNQGRIESANGYQAFWAYCEAIKSMEAPFIININRNIPAKAEYASIFELEPIKKRYIKKHKTTQATKGLVMVKFYEANGKPLGVESYMVCDISDSKYPDIDKSVIPNGREPEAVSKIGLNPELFSTIAKVFKVFGKHTGSTTEFYGDGQAIITTVINHELTGYVATMPMRF
ncbi:MAG: hypothetical protein IBX55_12940 [Methyloprofundus sp.]|nr:hypothetical protein [Methyloprofundus sp.]